MKQTLDAFEMLQELRTIHEDIVELKFKQSKLSIHYELAVREFIKASDLASLSKLYWENSGLHYQICEAYKKMRGLEFDPYPELKEVSCIKCGSLENIDCYSWHDYFYHTWDHHCSECPREIICVECKDEWQVHDYFLDGVCPGCKDDLICYLNSLPYSDYLKSDHWQELSKEVKSRDRFQCVQCGSKEKLEAHHWSYENRGNYRKEIHDLSTLCRECHRREHGIE